MNVEEYSMDNVGRRIEHLSDLQSLWGFALGLLLAGTYHTEEEREQAAALEIALDLLERHMSYAYSYDHQNYYARVINELPKRATDILGR
jgi:hypothetical protein